MINVKLFFLHAYVNRFILLFDNVNVMYYMAINWMPYLVINYVSIILSVLWHPRYLDICLNIGLFHEQILGENKTGGVAGGALGDQSGSFFFYKIILVSPGECSLVARCKIDTFFCNTIWLSCAPIVSMYVSVPESILWFL
jgi:hypothetical protein